MMEVEFVWGGGGGLGGGVGGGGYANSFSCQTQLS